MKRHPLIAFFVLMFGISWGVWLGLTYALETAPGRVEGSRWPAWLHVVGAFGPCFAALLVTAAAEGVEGLRRLFGRLLLWRVHAGWYAVALLLPAALSFLMTAIHMMFGGDAPDYRHPAIQSLALPGFLQNASPWILLVPVFVLQLFTGSSLGEELGWRGFALTRLQHRWSALDASLMIAVIWAVWAQPFFHLQRVQAGPWLNADDIRDLPALVNQLNRGTDPVSRYLQSRLSPPFRGLMASFSEGHARADDVELPLLSELNQVVYDAKLYDAERFKEVPLSGLTRRLLAQPESPAQQARLNRALLQDAYPKAIGWPWRVQGLAFILLLIGVIPAQVLITWIYNSTGGSLLLVVLYNNALKVTDMFLPAPNAGQFVPVAAYWLVTLLVISAVGARRLTLRPADTATPVPESRGPSEPSDTSRQP